MQVKSIAECILQYYFYHLSLRSLFCLFFEWPFYTGFTVYQTDFLNMDLSFEDFNSFKYEI